MRKKRLGMLFLSLGLLCGASGVRSAYAETSYGNPDWNVSFTEEKQMSSNFKTKDLDEAIYGLQPGDTAILTLKLQNANTATTDWYMTNKVLYSLEDRSNNSGTGGGAYTYILEYTDKDGKTETLFTSDTIGGEKKSAAGEGLKAATNSLDDFFYLDTLKKGEGGKITLQVALDGETQGNDYQDTLADLEMNFAVELNDTSTRTTPGGSRSSTVVRTGDETDIGPYVLTAGISGTILFLFAILSRRESKRQEKEVQ